MIKAVTVINYLGEQLKMSLTNPFETGFAITNIDGLGPGKSTINVTELTSTDGSLYNSARLSSRNIVLELRFLGTPDIESVRQKTYKYFPIKKPLTLVFETDRRTCYIDGYVESNEPVIFSEAEETQISIICPDPYFYSLSSQTSTFSGIVSKFEFPFSNEITPSDLEPTNDRNIELSTLEFSREQNIFYEGDSEIGVTIHLRSIGTVEHVTIYSTQTREFIKIDTDKLRTLTGNVIIAGDELTICTVKGKKSITLLREGETINILNCLTKDSSWIQLIKGDNVFAYTAEVGPEMLFFSVENNVVYEGV